MNREVLSLLHQPIEIFCKKAVYEVHEKLLLLLSDHLQNLYILYIVHITLYYWKRTCVSYLVYWTCVPGSMTANWCDKNSYDCVLTLWGRDKMDAFFAGGILLNENVCISINISLKSVPIGQINNIPALVQIMAWRQPGDKPLSEPVMFSWLTYVSLGLNELTLSVLKLIVGQYHGCWCLGSFCYQVISNHGIE